MQAAVAQAQGEQTDEVATAERVWKLLVEARTVMDVSVAGLTRLFTLMVSFARRKDTAVLSEAAFRLALVRYTELTGRRHEPILIKRLFSEFSSEEVEEKGGGGGGGICIHTRTRNLGAAEPPNRVPDAALVALPRIAATGPR